MLVLSPQTFNSFNLLAQPSELPIPPKGGRACFSFLNYTQAIKYWLNCIFYPLTFKSLRFWPLDNKITILSPNLTKRCKTAEKTPHVPN